MDFRVNEKLSTVTEVTSEMKESLNYVWEISRKNNISIELMSIVWLLSQDFISSAAYGPRKIDQLFNMLEIKDLTNNVNNAFDLNLLLSNSIPEIDQWKTRNLRNKFTIM